MVDKITETGTRYSLWVGTIYVFNLIVGTGALTMPKAFKQAGWILSLITVSLLCFTSFITVTFVMESMAIANAKLKTKPMRNLKEEDEGVKFVERLLDGCQIAYNLVPINAAVDSDGENADSTVIFRRNTSLNRKMDDEEPLLKEYSDGNCDVHPFEITERIELGQMAGMFFNRIGRTLFFLCIVIYLYGDAAIYAAAVPKSLRDVACTYKLPNGTACNNSLQDTDPCWSSTAVDRISGYRIFVAVFFIVMCPFAFFNVQKTKYLQIMTSASRWIAFGLMIILAAIRLGKHEGEGHPSVVEFSGIPNLFGVCVYSFMCHHSLPSMITPVENKSKLNKFLAADYILILGFYVVLSLTGIFAFDTIDDLYTLNFLPDDCNDSNQIIDFKPVQYFLALFPVFTLSTNFPIITITLRNNLKTLFYREGRPFPFIIDRIIFPLAAIIPPTAVAFGTDEVEFLVGITGSYAGAAIQYFIPAALVYCARKDAQSYFSANVKNQHTSPFNPLPNASSRRHS